MKKIIRLLPIIFILSWCTETPVDTTRETTANGIIIIMSGNSYKRQESNQIIQKNNATIEQLEKSNEFHNQIKSNMEKSNDIQRATLCELIWVNEKWYKCVEKSLDFDE